MNREGSGKGRMMEMQWSFDSLIRANKHDFGTISSCSCAKRIMIATRLKRKGGTDNFELL